MKLVLCFECHDVFKLGYDITTCKCGKCRGKYNKDGLTAVTNGEGLSIGMNNFDIGPARLAVDANKVADIKCWARPHEGEHNPNSKVRKDL